MFCIYLAYVDISSCCCHICVYSFSFTNTIPIFLYKYPFSNLTHNPFIVLHLVVILVASPWYLVIIPCCALNLLFQNYLVYLNCQFYDLTPKTSIAHHNPFQVFLRSRDRRITSSCENSFCNDQCIVFRVIFRCLSRLVLSIEEDMR